MNKFLFLFTILLYSSNSHSQINEVGLFVGGSNFVGDIGSTTYIHPESPAIGFIYKWNKTPRHSWRFSYTQSNIVSKDANSNDNSRKARGYEFDTTIKEIGGGIEFNFFDFDINNPLERKLTPYVFTGINMGFYNGTLRPKSKPNVDINEKSVVLPIILGVKSNLTSNFVVGFEIGARYALTDAIDGSFRENTTISVPNFGNLNNNDWYVFSGLTLTYTFGQKPCFCAE
jgi:hypothetical protein